MFPTLEASRRLSPTARARMAPVTFLFSLLLVSAVLTLVALFLPVSQEDHHATVHAEVVKRSEVTEHTSSSSVYTPGVPNQHIQSHTKMITVTITERKAIHQNHHSAQPSLPPHPMTTTPPDTTHAHLEGRDIPGGNTATFKSFWPPRPLGYPGIGWETYNYPYRGNNPKVSGYPYGPYPSRENPFYPAHPTDIASRLYPTGNAGGKPIKPWETQAVPVGDVPQAGTPEENGFAPQPPPPGEIGNAFEPPSSEGEGGGGVFGIPKQGNEPGSFLGMPKVWEGTKPWELNKPWERKLWRRGKL